MKRKPIRLHTKNSLDPTVIIALDNGQTHYLKHVMRKSVSDKIVVFNGKDGEWEAEITELGKKSGHIQILLQTREQTESPDIKLLFAPIKLGHIDYLIEKATELGVSSISPVVTQRTVVKRVNLDRLMKHAIEASEQCERLTVPKIDELQTLEVALKNWNPERKLILCDETGGGKPIADALSMHEEGKPYALLIGPEGGFTKDELAMLHKLPYIIPVGLGPRVLRADTAALAALSCIQSQLGDWSQSPNFEEES